jgi:hypothetical protein
MNSIELIPIKQHQMSMEDSIPRNKALLRLELVASGEVAQLLIYQNSIKTPPITCKVNKLGLINPYSLFKRRMTALMSKMSSIN